MARTRQTARRSTGGMAPHRQLAVSLLTDAEAVWSRQVQIYNETKCQTIAVEGSAELAETPDIIRLSFLVSEDNASSLKDGIGKVVDKIRKVREAVTALGVSNESISSDSISAKKKKIDYGDYDEEGNFKVHESKIAFHVKSVVRICLGAEGQEGKAEQQEHNVPDIQELFSNVCFTMTARLGINMQEAPNYELSDINELRNEARKGACENARLKATSMVGAMAENSKVKLGDPITITDIPVDLCDDAGQSFLGNCMDLRSYDTIQVVESTEERSRKRARREAIEPIDDKDENNDGEEAMGNMGSLDEETASQLFVVPSIKIAARVRAVFATS